MSKNYFFAYPSASVALTSTIKATIKNLSNQSTFLIEGWEQNDIPGRPLVDPIYEKIENAELLLADISKLNYNVTYEVGYAIGKQKRVYLLKNSEICPDSSLASKVGIYDTIGYREYVGQDQLTSIIKEVHNFDPLVIQSKINTGAPVWILGTPYHGDVMTTIYSHIKKKSRLKFRSFNPSEDPRLSSIQAIEQVSSSLGIIIPFVSKDYTDSEIHNLRAAFVAGLCHGMEKHTLILQDVDTITPLDFRDAVKTYSNFDQIKTHIADWSMDVYEALQSSRLSINTRSKPTTSLANLNLGDPTAENELETLENYYIKTDPYRRAANGEVNLVTGRKGVGKTALFSQLRNDKRRNKQNIVLDLKPEGYQLLKLKEDVLDFLAEGSKSHLITAFWEYILLTEVAHKLLTKDKERYRRDTKLFEAYEELNLIYRSSPYTNEGDFSERLNLIADKLGSDFADLYPRTEKQRLDSDNITELLHLQEIKKLQKTLSSYLSLKNECWILFDNLDKGWATTGTSAEDILILRCLIDATRKIQRSMRKDGHLFHSVIFIRNDIYQLLMEESSDFGKETRTSLDWSDSDLLREMLRLRLTNSIIPEGTDFQSAWNEIIVPLYNGEESSEYLITRSFMRPRNLLKLLMHCKGSAVNLGHSKIEPEDIAKALKNYSLDLVVDADRELTDIEPAAKSFIYSFIYESPELEFYEVDILMDEHKFTEEQKPRILQFLLYYGILGVRVGNKESIFIYDVNYNMEILKNNLSRAGDKAIYCLNPALIMEDLK